jgi:hypothetical protein
MSTLSCTNGCEPPCGCWDLNSWLMTSWTDSVSAFNRWAISPGLGTFFKGSSRVWYLIKFRFLLGMDWGQLAVVSSFLPLCGLRGLNSDPQGAGMPKQFLLLSLRARPWDGSATKCDNLSLYVYVWIYVHVCLGVHILTGACRNYRTTFNVIPGMLFASVLSQGLSLSELTTCAWLAGQWVPGSAHVYLPDAGLQHVSHMACPTRQWGSNTELCACRASAFPFFFKLTFIDSLWILYHVSQSHTCPFPLYLPSAFKPSPQKNTKQKQSTNCHHHHHHQNILVWELWCIMVCYTVYPCTSTFLTQWSLPSSVFVVVRLIDWLISLQHLVLPGSFPSVY